MIFGTQLKLFCIKFVVNKDLDIVVSAVKAKPHISF